MTAVLAPQCSESHLAVEGRFDAYHAPRFRDSSMQLRTSSDPIVTLDLRGVRYIDMGAIREVRRLEHAVAAQGRQFRLLVSDVVRVILELTGTHVRPSL